MSTPNPHDPDTTDFGYTRVPRGTKKPMVRAVFDSVAPRYDVMNDLMSLGIHRIWKRIFVTVMRPSPGRTLLDLASGTGDIAALWRQFGGGPVLLTDINASMLSVGRDRAIARARIDGLTYAVADAEALPLPPGCVDRVSIAFGLRNCTDKAAVLAEAFRVLRPGGRLFCLEFSKLQVAVLERAYERWSFDVLPRVGRVVAGDADSYRYLAESIRMFPDQETLAGMFAQAGFARVGFQNLSGGIAAIHSGCGCSVPRRILLVVAGGIAAYKSLELVRLLRRADYGVTAVLTEAGARFVTPLSLQALTESPVFTTLWSLDDESRMGHIELSRSADLVVVAPATADVMAKLAAGLAPDLASTLLLATDTPVLMAPAMNVRMWLHPATQANVSVLAARGVRFVGPDEGAMACHEVGPGRLAEPPEILAAIEAFFGESQALAGRHVLVTAGPTQEPIDAVRSIGNRSSGRQGFAIAEALRARGGRVTLVSGPVSLPDPAGVTVHRVETAAQMHAACRAALPADAAICAAAVADWRARDPSLRKLKKRDGPPAFDLVPTVDILAALAAPGPDRPRLVVGFAAETDDLLAHASAKRVAKNCDWIVANDVRAETGNMGGPSNTVHVIDASGVEHWPPMAKEEVAARLAARVAAHLVDGLADARG